jgi:hypothetical protein
MNDATKRFDERSRHSLEWSSYLYRIHCRNSNEFGETTRQSCDSMLTIELALMTVLSATIVAKNFAAPADAVQSLVHHNSIALAQISDCAAHQLHNTSDFVSENLRLQGKWYRLTVFVCVVVCMTREDVYISPTKTNCGHANQDFIRRNCRTRNVSHFETLNITQYTGLHRLSIHTL